MKVSASASIQLQAQYSPDGSRIAFASDRSGTREIWNCASDGTHCVQVTSLNAPFNNGPPRWSPDGKQIVFESMAAGTWDVYIVGANGGAPWRVNREGPHGGVPYWSHDGRWIYYSSLDTGTRQIWGIPAGGGKAVPITRDDGSSPLTDSSDSNTLYYDRGNKLFRSAADGSGEEELLSGVSYWASAVASNRIYYLHERSDGSAEIRQYLLATGDDSRLATINKPVPMGLSLSADAKSLIYSEFVRRGNVMLAENLY